MWKYTLKILPAVLFLYIVFLTGCIEPAHRLSKGLPDANDLIVFATAAPDNILVYSVQKAKMEHTLPADIRLNSMVIDKAGKLAYVATKNGWLNVFNLQRGDREARVRVGTILQSLALSSDGKYLAVGVGSEEDYNAHDISIRRTDNINDEIMLVNVGGDIQDLVANPANQEFYIVNTSADKVRIFNFDQNELVGIIPLGGSPSMMVVSPDGKKIYATLNAQSSVAVIDVETRSNLIRYDLPGTAPHYLAFSEDGSKVVVSDRDSARVFFIDNVNNTLLGYKPFPDYLASKINPEIIEFSSNAEYLYIISSRQTDLMVVDIRTMHLAQTYNLPKRPTAMQVIRGSTKHG